VAKDDPDRTAGSWNQTAGSAKEFVGGVIGSEVRLTTHHPTLPHTQ
jgi:uncharacterized protein YjbJ (UPF0337 family)